MCSVPSVATDKDSCRKVVDSLGELLLSIEAKVTIYETESNPVIWAEVGEGDKTFMIYGHYDVQPVDDENAWNSSPYKIKETKDKYYGRGVCDCKGNIIANIFAVKAYLDEYGKLPCRIIFFLEGDEERGSPTLEKFSSKNKKLFSDVDFCMFPGEQNYIDPAENNVVTVGYKGCYYCELEVTGANTPVHSSLGTLIENPAWRLVWALSTIKNEKDEILINEITENAVPPTKKEEEVLKKWPFDTDKVKKQYSVKKLIGDVLGYAAKKKHIFEPTCTVCGIWAGNTGEGVVKTIVPNKATVKLDFRLVPNLTPDFVENALRNHLDENGFADVTVKNLVKLPVGYSDLDSPIYKTVSSVMKDVYGKEPKYLVRSPGGGPQYYICSQFGVPVFTAGVGYYGSKVHAPDENVRINDFYKHMEFVFSFLENLGQKGGKVT